MENGNQYNAAYAQTVYSAINYALNLGLTVVINCQTQQSGTTRTYNYPNDGNTATNSFWDYMLTSKGGNYHGNSRVICDLFNEPQCGPNWTTWKNAYNGLISYIRSTLGVTGNQLWADADNYAANGNQLSWSDGLYQGWSPGATPGGSMVAGVAAFNSFTADMATGSGYRMHVSFSCIHPDNGSMTAVVGVHGVSS